MSAPSSMGRTAILIVILAVGLAAFASDAPTGAAHPHRKVVAARIRHSTQAKPVSRVRETANQRRHTLANRSASRSATPHSSYRSHRAEAHETQSTPHVRIAVERFSVPRHRAVTAEQLRQAREVIAEREKHEAQPAEQAAITADEANPAIDEAKSGVADAQSSAAPEPANAQEPALPPAESADEPAPADNDARPLTEQASLSIPRGVMPTPLWGSHESLERQDERLQADGLERIENESDLSSRIEHHLLVPVPASDALTVNAELPANHRYCRPWTARFLADLARAHQAAFHRPIEVSSAVRTVEYQQHLMRINGNAAPADGDIFSPHLMGATIDIAKGQMTRDEIAWMRRHLLALQLAGKIDVEEEFEQACFHISVYKSYAPPRASRAPKSRAGAKRKSTTPDSTPDVAQTSGQ
jgi:hypothetical protein